MAVRYGRGDVKQTTTGFRGPLMVQSLTSAKSKFLSLNTTTFSKYLRKFFEHFQLTNKDQWPVPDYNKHDEASFIFVICPPYSGSTAFSQLFSSSRYVAQLNRKAEGQQLIPGLFQADRWHKDKHVSYESIRAVWLAKYQQIKRKNASIEWVIEKSPPNMMRLASLQACFSSNFTIALIRDPYATCASAVYRNVKNIESLSIKERKLCFQRSAQRWVKKSTHLRSRVKTERLRTRS